MTKAQTTNGSETARGLGWLLRVAELRVDWGDCCARVREKGTATPQTCVIEPVF